MLRDTGSSNIGLRPDGGTGIGIRVPTSIPEGAASVITNLKTPGAVDKIKNGVSSVLNDPNKPATTGKNLSNLVPNPLEQFASYSTLWTFACLEPKQFNNPKSYRNSTGDLKHVIFSSGGRFDSQRVNTYFGAPEYYVNNFIMKATVAANERTGNSNAFKFEFEIYEPHSMGLLLQSLQNAALKAGYLNYLDNCPYVLRMDFQGFDELGKAYTSVKPKFFVMKLTGVKFSVTEGGSTYKMEAVPYNHQGFSDVTNTVYNDLKLTAGKNGTVEEVLRSSESSLMAALNDAEQRAKKENLISIPDQYDIQFPAKSSDFTPSQDSKVSKGATENPNEEPPLVIKGSGIKVKTSFDENPISGSSFGFSQADGGNFVFKKHGDTVDEKTGVVKRDNMSIDPKNRTFQFSQGQTITAMINQIILSSQYVRDAIDPKNLVNGFIKWYKIDIQVELLDYDPLTGDFARKITFRIVPFLVHHTIFSNPSAAPIGYQELQKKIVKEYNYIYTGQNVDVLKFDIQINNLFYTGTNPSPESSSGNISNPATQGTAERPNQGTQTGSGASPGAQAANLGRARPKRDPELLKNKPVGGTDNKVTEQQIAEGFQKAFVSGSSADLIKISIEILGDPYWLVDSGMNNYFSPAQPESQITEDGTMNYESGDVYVYLTFRTPSDINEKTGLYEFATVGKESPFSGIYRVIMCESQFNDGQFKQKLECIRMPGQASDYKDGAKPLPDIKATKENSMARQTTKAEPAPSTLVDDPSGDGSGGE